MNMRRMTLLSLLILALAACGPRPQPTTDESPLPGPGVSPLSPLPTPLADSVASAAVAHLAAELEVPPEAVTILSSEAVEWPDASLGCPQPGMMYAQVVSPGYRFLMEVAGEQYDVHTDQTGQSVVICQPASG